MNQCLPPLDPEWPPVKGQHIRLLDVFLIGPLMMLGGVALAQRARPLAGLTLWSLGASTIVFNAVNYGRVRERQRLYSMQQVTAWKMT
jgi:hypothetical protein